MINFRRIRPLAGITLVALALAACSETAPLTAPAASNVAPRPQGLVLGKVGPEGSWGTFKISAFGSRGRRSSWPSDWC